MPQCKLQKNTILLIKGTTLHNKTKINNTVLCLNYIILFYHNRSCFGNVYPYASELNSRIQETNCLIFFIQLLSNLISTFIPNKFPVNLFTLFVTIQYYFIAKLILL